MASQKEDLAELIEKLKSMDKDDLIAWIVLNEQQKLLAGNSPTFFDNSYARGYEDGWADRSDDSFSNQKIVWGIADEQKQIRHWSMEVPEEVHKSHHLLPFVLHKETLRMMRVKVNRK